jgi:hypothetical protein
MDDDHGMVRSQQIGNTLKRRGPRGRCRGRASDTLGYIEKGRRFHAPHLSLAGCGSSRIWKAIMWVAPGAVHRTASSVSRASIAIFHVESHGKPLLSSG